MGLFEIHNLSLTEQKTDSLSALTSTNVVKKLLKLHVYWDFVNAYRNPEDVQSEALTHYYLMDSSTPFLWAGPCLLEDVFGLFLLLSFIIEIPVLNANSVDSDHTLRSTASDLCLFCL